MTDINKALEENEEINILHTLMTPKIGKIICLMNKCDDIYYDNTVSDLVFLGKHTEETYIKANNHLSDIAKKCGLDNEDFTPFFPVSLKNFIETESSLNSGYENIKLVLQKTILKNREQFILNSLDRTLANLETELPNNISIYITSINHYVNKMKIAESIGVDKISYDNFWKIFNNTISNYVSTATSIDTNIIHNNDLVHPKNFDALHCTFGTFVINMTNLMDCAKQIPYYPREFLESKQAEVISKILHMYDQLCSVETTTQTHTCPPNVMYYLQIVETCAYKDFDDYAAKFLKVYCNPKCMHSITYHKKILDLVQFISKNVKINCKRFQSLVCIILLNRQRYILQKFPKSYLSYLVQMKKLIKSVTKNRKNKCGAYDILYELTNKNIHDFLKNGDTVESVSFFGNIFRNLCIINPTKEKYCVSNFFEMENDGLNKTNDSSSVFLHDFLLYEELEYEMKMMMAFE